MSNPLLSASDLPLFADIRPEHVGPALDQLLPLAQAALERALGDDVAPNYDALSAVLDVPLERLSRAWSAVAHLNAVADTPDLRQAYSDNLTRITDFYTRLGADQRLYAKYKTLAQGAQAQSVARQRALTNAMRDFILAGAELQGPARERFAVIQGRSAELSQRYSEHVLDATDQFSMMVTAEQIAGVPDDVCEAARTAALADGAEGFKLTLHEPCWTPVLMYAHDRELRQQMYRARVTRASEWGPPQRDNSAVMAEMLALRHEEAALLGHTSFAELSLVPKMAHSTTQVAEFLRDLAQRARPHAQRDLDEVRRYARDHLALPDLQAWDMTYASEKLKEARYSFSDQEVKAYFTEPQVLSGLFNLIETLFDVRIRADSAAVWHDSVRFYRIERRADEVGSPAARGVGPGALVGQFYLDPYARAGKRPGAWMDEVRSRWLRPDATAASGNPQTPVAQLVCNFASPVGQVNGQPRPALLTHDDVVTLFHEFGHGLHHLLTQVDDLAVAGISGVEWDAVELPSQFMENFCWEWSVLSRLTAHVETGAPMPRALFDRMLAARNFQSGLQTLRQVEFALFDLRIHSEPDAADRVQAVLDEVRAEVTLLPVPDYNRFAHSFSHIFSGGYAAGYYSYKWAEVLSADAYSAFEEAGVFDAETGRRYRREILEAGGSRPAMENFKAFRGREPSIDALLRHQGMLEDAAPQQRSPAAAH